MIDTAIDRIDIPGTEIRIYIAPIVPEAGADRRQREKNTVSHIITRTLGPDVRLAHDSDGRPLIPGAGISISISHSMHHAAVAVAPADSVIGLDIEERRAQLAKVAPRILSPDELAVYAGPESDSGLIKAWTLKEAIYKAAQMPGLDFREEISLPLSAHDDTATTTRNGMTKKFRILHSLPYGVDAWLTLVIAI